MQPGAVWAAFTGVCISHATKAQPARIASWSSCRVCVSAEQLLHDLEKTRDPIPNKTETITSHELGKRHPPPTLVILLPPPPPRLFISRRPSAIGTGTGGRGKPASRSSAGRFADRVLAFHPASSRGCTCLLRPEHMRIGQGKGCPWVPGVGLQRAGGHAAIGSRAWRLRPDQQVRLPGCMTGWDRDYDGDLALPGASNVVRDARIGSTLDIDRKAVVGTTSARRSPPGAP